MRVEKEQEAAKGDIINLTPVIDMMFILVIFFALSSAFREEERDIQVNLPAGSQSTTLSASRKVIIINVRKSGVYVIGNAQATLEEISDRVKSALKEDPEQKVLVRADEQALHGYVAQAVAACRIAGVKEANIGYKLPE